MRREALIIALLIVLGIGSRVVLIYAAGRSPGGPLSGGSDAPAYILLGKSVSAGQGLAYVGRPTALRAPLYPILLAGLDLVFGSWSLFVMRWLQFVAAIAMAWICAETAIRLSGKDAKWVTFGITVAIPTLLFFTPQILTEAFTELLVAAFIYFLIRSLQETRLAWLIGMGATAGVLMLLRFNTLYIPAVAAVAAAIPVAREIRWKRALVPAVLAAVIVSPWVIRNWEVFHGGILYSSQTGTTALQGALAPEGRTQRGEQDAWKRSGWWLTDIETDNPRRLQFPSEPVLNRRAQAEAISAWRSAGWRVLPLEIEKIGYFWLSADQLFSTSSLPTGERFIRVVGVLIYWLVLALAVIGWMRLRVTAAQIANVLLFYGIVGTALHLPFPMNTRYRIPLMDPVLCVLAGIELAAILRKRHVGQSVKTAETVLASAALRG